MTLCLTRALGRACDPRYAGAILAPTTTMAIQAFPSSMPESHRQFLRTSVERLMVDRRLVGVAAGGSYLTDSMDEFSDLDLIIAVQPEQYAEVVGDRVRIANSIGQLLAAFTGEHVGEPRVLICLYECPLLHVDLKFVSVEDAAKRVEDPFVLWERDGRLTSALSNGNADYPSPDPQWIEDRFWIWVHYAATKVGRGELFEAIDFLSFIRGNVLGPLALRRAGARPAGVRRIESVAPEFARQLCRTVASHDTADCLRALRASVELYRSLVSRPSSGPTRVEEFAMGYLSEMEQRCGLS